MKKLTFLSSLTLLSLALSSISSFQVSGETFKTGSKEPLSVSSLTCSNVSPTEVVLSFSDIMDFCAEKYQIMRRDVSSSDTDESWQCIAELISDGAANGTPWMYTDQYQADGLKQYAYRVDIVAAENNPDVQANYDIMPGDTVYASNAVICIDPGHYAGENAVYRERSSTDAPYAEGDFNLEVALKLKEVLENQCGIRAVLTRDSGSITINGYTDGGLDSGHISMRGEAAAGCDLFLSIHTNANLDYANGYPTQDQPAAITKTLVIVNQPAIHNQTALSIGNAIGRNLSQLNYELGISEMPDFRTAWDMGAMQNWSDAWNDALNIPGAVCYRISSNGVSDYYGVLRGAANVNVPGMIVEHAYHTVPVMRVLAADGELAEKWAQADAEGIAEGFGFEIKKK